MASMFSFSLYVGIITKVSDIKCERIWANIHFFITNFVIILNPTIK
jgi:hypothetical protein